MKQKLLFFPRLIWNFFMRLFLKSYVQLSFKGLAQLPKNQKFIIVSNHTSHLDALCLVAAVPLKQIQKTYVAAAKDCFFRSFWRSIFFKFVINAIPFDRFNNPFQSLSNCAEKIVGKQSVLVFFPEGTRSSTGVIQKFKPGIGRLAAGTETLVVPAYIEGAHQAWPKTRWLPLPYAVKITFGKPLSFSNIPRTKKGFLFIANELEKEVKQIFTSELIPNMIQKLNSPYKNLKTRKIYE